MFRRGSTLALKEGQRCPWLLKKWNVPANEEQLRDGWATILGTSLASDLDLLLKVQIMPWLHLIAPSGCMTWQGSWADKEGEALLNFSLSFLPLLS